MVPVSYTHLDVYKRQAGVAAGQRRQRAALERACAERPRCAGCAAAGRAESSDYGMKIS